MEHNHCERELKYLLEKGTVSLEQILALLNKHGYQLEKYKPKEKHEAYYDDGLLTLTKSQCVIRESHHLSPKGKLKKHRFMYKTNVSDINKPYVSKLELGSGKFKSVNDFIAALDLDIDIVQNPFLYAEVKRRTAVVKKGFERLLISHDKIKYSKGNNSPIASEEELELEDWTNPHTGIWRDCDARLCETHDILTTSGLPLEPTKRSKHCRGHELLGGKTQ